MNIISIYHKWRISKNHRHDLDFLLTHIPKPQADLKTKVNWLYDMLNWIRNEGLSSSSQSLIVGNTQFLRVKYLVHKLKLDNNLANEFGECVAFILCHTETINLFCNIGLVDQDSFLLDLNKRLYKKILPSAQNENDLSQIISTHFDSESDYVWLAQLDEATREHLYDIINHKKYNLKEHFKNQAIKSLVILSSQAVGLSFSNEIRDRCDLSINKENPFINLFTFSQQLLNDSVQNEQMLSQIELECVKAFEFIEQVHKYLEQNGVDTNIVYKLEKLESELTRIYQIVNLILSKESNVDSIFTFLQHLIFDNVRNRSIIELLKDTLSLISRKITERSAETGEHYITRNFQEFLYLFKKAIGGGVLTSLTVVIKLLLSKLYLSGIAIGVLASLNYVASFLLIHAMGFTLATKQPAMTASTLAAKMKTINGQEQIDAICDEIIHLIRSQSIAVLGNIMAVVPSIAVLYFAFVYFSTDSNLFIDLEKANKIMSDFSVFGMTPVYAIFTGLLLFASSLVAGWFDNWFVYHRLEQVICENRRLHFVFGVEFSKKMALFFKKHIAAIAANVSLGFFLGLTPVIADFLHLPIDVRHVTLSTGSLALAGLTIGLEVFLVSSFWFAVLGIIIMAILNLGVSFLLALFTAIRAQKIKALQRGAIYHNLIMRFKNNPLVFILPPKS